MNCYVCRREGRTEPAVALCRYCWVGLCLNHLAEAQEHTTGGMHYDCPHQLPKLSSQERR